ncbi:MAG: VOC family protein, partial [Planctomycetota bacterium]
PQRLVALLALPVFGACSSTEPIVVPPIATSGTYEPGRFVWHDLITPDVASAHAFYGGLFGWTFELQSDGDYSVVRHDGRAIGGILDADRVDATRATAIWVCSISVGDVDAATSRVRDLGGTVYESPTDLPDRGRAAVLGDDQGGFFAVLRSTSGDPTWDDPGIGEWLWHELACVDPAAAGAFYASAIGYTTERRDESNDGRPYVLLRSDERPEGGVTGTPFEEERGLWIPYIRVASASAAAARARELGGTIVIEPDATLRGGSVALVTDPHGALLALQEWQPE